MGMDILLIRCSGKRKDGYLNTKYVCDDYEWEHERCAIRHRFCLEVEQDVLTSDVPMDLQYLYRPSSFEKAFGWASKLEGYEREYIENILNILKSDDTLYLEYSF